MATAKNHLNIAYRSAGWPLSSFPSGIVSYLDNLFEGFGQEVRPCVFAEGVADDYEKPSETIIDLSDVAISKHFLQKAYEKIIYGFNIPQFEPLGQNILAHNFAKKVSIAIQQSDIKLDLFETEESFGYAYFLAKEIKVPIITRLHGPHFILGHWEASKHTFRNRVALEERAIKSSVGITAPSETVLAMTRDFYNLDIKDAKVIANPVKPPQSDDFWQLPSSSKRQILFVGRFDYTKGADLLLKAFKMLAIKNTDLVLNFVGQGRGIDLYGKRMSFWDYVNATIPEDRIRNRINFLGHLNQKKIAELRKNATVTIVSSRFESFGISLVEALAAGCPVVATNVGAIPEIVVDGVTGLLAEAESSESIAEKVQLLLDNQEKLSFLSRNAAKDVENRFYPKIIASKMTQYYTGLVK